MLKIELTSGIHLGLIEKRHSPQFFSYIQNNMDNFKGILNFVDRMKNQDAVDALVKAFADMQTAGTGFLWGIWENDSLIGSINAHDINLFVKSGEISYFIDKNHEGKGIMSKAFGAILAELFVEYKLQRVFLRCSTENERSQNIAKRHGFIHEGTERRVFMANGKLHDLMTWSMLKEEYEEWQKTDHK